MVKKTYPHEYTDANGNTVVQNADGSSELYVGGRQKADKWLDVSDEADAMVKRKRFLPDISSPPAIELQTRQAEEEALPGVDDLEE